MVGGIKISAKRIADNGGGCHTQKWQFKRGIKNCERR